VAEPAERPDGFRYAHPIEIRYVDTDALGHVNNAVYLSYFEMARAGYYAAVTGSPFGTGEFGGAHTFVIAEARISYRQPARFGEPLISECRVAWVSRSSFGLEYRIRAEPSSVGAPRLVADGETVQVMVDPETNRVRRVPADLLASIERFEGGKLPAKPSAGKRPAH
jgi:acyl-CoA thioester hydrolase